MGVSLGPAAPGGAGCCGWRGQGALERPRRGGGDRRQDRERGRAAAELGVGGESQAEVPGEADGGHVLAIRVAIATPLNAWDVPHFVS